MRNFKLEDSLEDPVDDRDNERTNHCPPPNETMWNPGITSASSQKNAPFKMIPNMPSVRMLIGSVRSEMIGLMTKLTNIKHAPTIKMMYVG